MDIFSIIDLINPERFVPLLYGEGKDLYFAYIHPYALLSVPYITGAFYVLILVFLAGIMFILINLPALHRKDYETFKYEPPPADAQSRKDPRWQVIENHLVSLNPAEWKLAVLEADNLLDDMLKQAGYAGDTLGERLTEAGTSGMRSIQSAWDAHKVRNTIAHQGGLDLTRREAERAVGLFREALAELGYEF